MDRLTNKVVLLGLSVFYLTSCFEGGSGSEGGSTATAVPHIEEPVPLKNLNLVCDALHQATNNDFRTYQGIVSNLFYLDINQPRYTDVNDYIGQGVPVSEISIFFNALAIPTRPFDRGFVTTTGEVIKTPQGDTLYEWFGLEFKTDLVLGENDTPGNYQLALLSDDGAVLSLRDQSGAIAATVVDNNGTHPTRFACASQAVSMQYDMKLPVTLRYYQGPRYHIALSLMWRPWPQDPALVNDLDCGTSGNSRFFNSNLSPPQPTQVYQNMLLRGWRPLSGSNFLLPQGLINACNIPAPTITNVTAASIGANVVELAWSTDVASTSQVEVLDMATNQVLFTTEINLQLVQSHSVSVSGLQANSLYSLTPISMSDSGKTTRGESLIVRTRR